MEPLPRPFKIAKQASTLAMHDAFKVGAVIIQGNRVISIGWNDQHKTHPGIKRYGGNALQTLHAEAMAILRSRHKASLKGAKMYVYRAIKDGTLANARPCITCQNIMKAFGITRMYYTINNGWAYEAI